MDVCGVSGSEDVENRRYAVRRLWLAWLARESFTVIGPDRRPVPVVDDYLAWLTDCERSPNTVEAYACLSCPSFLTDASFRSVHEQQRAETEQLLGKAREADSVRLVELLGRDHASLTRILESLDAIEAEHAAAEIDIRDLTSAGPEEQAA